MTIQTKKVDYIPATQRESTTEYENTIKNFQKSKDTQRVITLTDDDKRTMDTIAGGLRRAIERMNIEDIEVKQRTINDELQVYLEKVE